MWYVFVMGGQAYCPTQSEPEPTSQGRWYQFDNLEDAEEFVSSYNNPH